MGSWKTHLIGGIAVYLILIYAYKIQLTDSLIYLAIILFFSLFPDIDTKSKIQKWLSSLFFILEIFYILTKQYFECAVIGIFVTSWLIFPHRKLYHNIVFLLSLNFIVYYFLGDAIAIAMAAGWISHLFFDKMIIKK